MFKTVNKFKEIDKNRIVNELIINELENKCDIFIEIILLLVDKEELINILDNIDLDELKYDIPTIKDDFIELKKKLIKPFRKLSNLILIFYLVLIVLILH